MLLVFQKCGGIMMTKYGEAAWRKTERPRVRGGAGRPQPVPAARRAGARSDAGTLPVRTQGMEDPRWFRQRRHPRRRPDVRRLPVAGDRIRLVGGRRRSGGLLAGAP